MVDAMEKRSLKPYFMILVVLALASLALAYTVDVNLIDQAGIKTQLPNRVGDWQGFEIRYCQNRSCMKDFSSDGLTNLDVCPVCGGPLGPMTLIEAEILPADTVLVKKKYINSQKRVLMVSVVLTGKERVSIHRAQACLTAAGNEIQQESVLDIPMEGRDPLQVMLMDTIGKGRTADGQRYELPTYYAYWFVGKGRETPYHSQRMLWMATDRVFRSLSHRWAYVAVAGMRSSDDSYKELLASFLHDFYPQILVD